jgi:hypothetical protein
VDPNVCDFVRVSLRAKGHGTVEDLVAGLSMLCAQRPAKLAVDHLIEEGEIVRGDDGALTLIEPRQTPACR